MIKKIFSVVFDIMDSLARARAAAVLARQGQHEAARWLISNKT